MFNFEEILQNCIHFTPKRHLNSLKKWSLVWSLNFDNLNIGHTKPDQKKVWNKTPGPYKRVYIAAHQCLLRRRHSTQGAEVHEIHLYIAAVVHKPQYTRDKRVSRVLRRLVYCCCRSLPWYVKFNLPQYKPFYPAPKTPNMCCCILIVINCSNPWASAQLTNQWPGFFQCGCKWSDKMTRLGLGVEYAIQLGTKWLWVS